MFAVGFDGGDEGLFGAFHEVAAAAAVHVYVDAAGEHVCAFGVYDFVHARCGSRGVQDFFDTGALDEDASVFNPAAGCEDFAVDDLSEHFRLLEMSMSEKMCDVRGGGYLAA